MPENASNKALSRRIEELEQSNRLLQQEIQGLRERENHFSSLLAGIPVGLYRTDSEGRILEANPALVEMLGYSDRESLLLTNAVQFFVNPEDLKEQRRILTRDGILRGFEMELRRADGSTFWVKDSAKVVENGDGDIFFEGSLEDIDERKKMERSLLKSQHNMRGILDATLETIVLIDRRGTIIAANKTASLRLGVGIKDLIGSCVYDYFPADVAENRRRKWEKVFTEGSPLFFEDSRSGRTYAQSAYPVFDDKNDRVEHVVLFASDITESKRAEEELRRRKNLLERIFEILPIGLWFADKDGTLLRGNPMGVQIWGAEPKVPISEYGVFKAWRLPSREPVEAGDWALAKTIRNGITIVDELLEIESFDGKRKTILNYTAPVLDDNGNVDGAIVVNLDISDRKALESQLRQAQKMEAIGTLAGGIAHDFNNILGIIVGNAELAMFDIPECSSAQESLKEIHEASLRARDLITQILLFARQKEHKLSNIRIEPIAKESLKMLRASIPTTVEINQEIQEDLPSVLADAAQIQQIIMNLCTNASQVMEAEGGTLILKLDLAELNASMDTQSGRIPKGRHVRVQVQDTGPGISPENLERIFEPFFTTKGVGQGTGLGLAVVHGIIEDSKGGILVESEEGKGTIFTVYLPASEEAPADESAEEESVLPKGNERILFVDDEPMILKLGQRMLERQGYKVETRASGTDALECFKQDPERFDLVVTDMTMPGLRGDHLTREILKIRPGIPVILSTGFSKQISEEKAEELGIRAFVMKPLTAQELASTVRKVLDEK